MDYPMHPELEVGNMFPTSSSQIKMANARGCGTIRRPNGVLSSFPGHVQKTLPTELKTEVGTARMAWLNPVPK